MCNVVYEICNACINFKREFTIYMLWTQINWIEQKLVDMIGRRKLNSGKIFYFAINNNQE